MCGHDFIDGDEFFLSDEVTGFLQFVVSYKDLLVFVDYF